MVSVLLTSVISLEDLSFTEDMTELSLKKLCCTCLSTERNLHHLSRVFDGVNLLYTLLMHDPETDREGFYKDTSSLRVCWECAAILRKIKVFQVQACVVQKQLIAVVNGRNDIKLKTFSKLTTAKTKPKIEYQCNETPVDPFIECRQDDIKMEIEFDENQPESHENEADRIELFNNIARIDNKQSAVKKPMSKVAVKTEIQECKSDDAERTQTIESHVERTQTIESNVERTQTIESHVERTQTIKCNVERTQTFESDEDRTQTIDSNAERTQTIQNDAGKTQTIEAHMKNADEVESNDIDDEAIEMKYKEHFAITVMDENEMNKSVEERRKALNESGALRKCESCLLVFKRKSQMNAHNRQFHEKKLDTVKCHMCQSYVEDILTHKETHYHKYRCVWCEYVTYTNQDIIQHLKEIHRRLFVKKTAPGIQNGLKSDDTFDYPCEECDEAFLTSKLLWRHVQKAHREGFKCKTCGLRFAFKDGLKAHELRVHSGPHPRKPCPVCKKEIRTVSMSAHLRTHTERQTYVCVACDKSFVCRGTYEAHMKLSRAHASIDVTGNKCQSCNKVYRYRRDLEDHINFQHKNLTLHKCTVCEKALATKNNLLIHVKRVHGGLKRDKDKQCAQCGKAFMHNKSLKEHELIHSGVRPLSCSICGRDFRQRAALYTHMRRVHKGMKE